MGRYYDDKISTAGLDPANPFFQALNNAANAVDRAESDWYERRKDVFDELDFGDFRESARDVERKYSRLVSGLSVYEFKDKFDDVSPSRRPATDVFRLVHNTFPTSEISEGYATDIFVEEADDDDGDTAFVVADNVLRYHVSRGKGNVDTLYDNLSAFRTSSRSDAEFYEFIDDDDDPGHFLTNNVFKGFGEVPLAWQAKSDYTSQQLQVMNAAGNDYNDQVGPKIQAYNEARANYEGAGGGPLESEFYDGGTPDFLYQDFQGTSTSYNRPENLPAVLIKETRGFGT